MLRILFFMSLVFQALCVSNGWFMHEETTRYYTSLIIGDLALIAFLFPTLAREDS